MGSSSDFSNILCIILITFTGCLPETVPGRKHYGIGTIKIALATLVTSARVGVAFSIMFSIIAWQ